MSCSVCIEPFNSSTRKPVHCRNKECEFVACRVCYERYLVSTIEEAHCMACKQTWDVHFLYTQFTKKFVNDVWWVHRVRCMVDREKSLLPNAMRYVKMLKRFYHLKSDIIYLRMEITELQRQYHELDTKEEKKSLAKVIREKKAQLKKCRYEVRTHIFFRDPELERRYHVPRDMDDPIHHIYGNQVHNTTTSHSDETKKIERFTWPCPQPQCRGFLDSKFYCSLCYTHVCSKCHAIVGVQKNEDMKEGDVYQDHTCKEDDIKSIAQKKKNTCSCPKCNVLIYRVSGCNQMWCTQCYTPFDFKTRKIVTGRIHNPHYFDHLYRTTPPQTNDNVIDRRCHIDHCYVFNVLEQFHFGFLKSLTYRITHYQDVVINEYVNQRDLIPYHVSSLVLRIKYLMHKISETEWLKQIKTNEKSRLFFMAIIPIYITWSETCRDCILNIQQMTITPPNSTSCNTNNDMDIIKKQVVDQIVQIIEFTRISNEQLHKIMLCYHMSGVLIELTSYRYYTRVDIPIVSKQITNYINMYIDPIRHRKEPILKEKSVEHLKSVLYNHPSASFRIHDHTQILGNKKNVPPPQKETVVSSS